MNNEKESVFLKELKHRLIKVLIAFILAFIFSSLFAEEIFSFLVSNLTPPNGVSLIISSPSSSAFILINVILATTLSLMLPFLIYQLIGFIKPALTSKEKSWLFQFLIIFTLLFTLGITFGFFVTKYILIPFLAQLVTGTQVANMWDVSEFIKFFLMICLGMGFIFQLPLVVSFLVKLHIVTTATLSKYRKHVFIVLLITIAFITPNGDPFSLMMVSLPIFLLFELSLFIGKILEKRQKNHE